MIRLFDIQKKKVIPSEHCYTIKWLSIFMDEKEYSDEKEHLKIYPFLFYMNCPYQELNPYAEMKDADREVKIYNDLDCDFSLEDPNIIHAMERCKDMYSTPVTRMYSTIQKAIDKISTSIDTANITLGGKDANITAILKTIKDFNALRKEYKDAYQDVEEEARGRTKANKKLGYDQEGMV
jgi:hypothetical protein